MAPLENRQADAISAFVASKCSEISCGVCDAPAWEAYKVYGLDAIAFLETPGPEPARLQRLVAHGPAPDDLFLAVRCKGCGRTLFFETAAAGIETG